MELPTRTQMIVSLVAAARADGLTPVVEDSSVDLRIMNADQTIAAIRVHIGDGSCLYEVPARPGVGPHRDGPVRLDPWGTEPFEPRHMRDLNRLWAQIPGTGRTWRARTEPWMLPGYWAKANRLGTRRRRRRAPLTVLRPSSCPEAVC